MYNANKTINGLDVETTIADTDELVFGDVSDSNRAKKITFSNFKNEVTSDDTAFVRKSLYDANSILYATSDDTPVALTVGTNSVVGRVAGTITTLAVDSDLTSVSASDDTVPSAKATKTALDLKALDSAVVHNTGNETIAGIKTFSSDPIIPDEAYGSGWNGVLEPPTKNAIYDKIETLANFNNIPNTSVSEVNYLTYQIMPQTDVVDSLTNGWTESGITIATNQGGAGVIEMTATADGSFYTKLPGIGSNSFLRFADIGANAISIKFRLKLGTVDTGERIGFGLASAVDVWQKTQTDFGDSAIRFVLIESSGDKLYAVNSNGSANTNTNITGALTLTNWHTYQIILTSSAIKFYIDGTQVGSDHTTNIPTSTSDILFGFGKEYNGGSSTFMTLAPTLITLPLS